MSLGNSSITNDNIIYKPENNWSILPEDTEVWNGSLPFSEGSAFPTANIINRANISNTNRLIYENDTDEIYTNILSVFPEIDPMYGWQIREIIAKLPYFKNSTNAWVGLVAGDVPLIDTSEELDVEMSELLEESNLAETLQNEIKSRFLDVISAYRVETDLAGKPYITAIDCKNLICYVNKDMPSSIEVNVVFSVYEDENGKFIDFVEYHYNGYIKKTTFKYNDGVIGELIDEKEDEAFGGKFKYSPIVVFRHNTTGNKVYGTDQYRYWYPSMLGVMRELQNVLRLGERTREMIRKVPDSAVRKSEIDGSSVFFNKGTIGYRENGDGKSPDMEYVVPEIRMEEAVKALEAAIKEVSIDTQLGIAFFDPTALGSRLSSDSLKASMFAARVEAKRITTEMKKPLKDIIVKIGYLSGLDINPAKLSVEFYDGFPKDSLEDVEAVQMRLESETPSISLVGAIMKLDKVSLRVAQQKAIDIITEKEDLAKLYYSRSKEDENIERQIDENKINDSTELKPTAGTNGVSELGVYEDSTVWENQMFIRPRNIPQGNYIPDMNNKGVKSKWIRRKLRERV